MNETRQAAEHLRRVLEIERDTRLALKRGRAELFLELAEAGVKPSHIWQRVAVDPTIKELENVYEEAHIRLVVENAVNWGRLVPESGEE